MGNAPSEIDDGGKRNRITPNMSRQNTQITVRPVDEGMEMDFVDERSMSRSPSQVFAERAWRDTPDGRTPSPNPMPNGGNYKKKKTIDRLNQVMDYVSFIFLCIKIFHISARKINFLNYISIIKEIYTQKHFKRSAVNFDLVCFNDMVFKNVSPKVYVILTICEIMQTLLMYIFKICKKFQCQ